MAEYHVGCGLAAIYAGTVKKNGYEWLNRTECTDEAINAVCEYMVSKCLGGYSCEKGTKGGFTWDLKDGRTVRLMVEIEKTEDKKAICRITNLPCSECQPVCESRVEVE